MQAEVITMSEDSTEDMSIGHSLAKIILTRLDAIESRLEKLEHQTERQAMETKPIWERALAEIMEVRNDVHEVRERVDNVERKVVLLHGDMLQFRADQVRLEQRVEEIESKPS